MSESTARQQVERFIDHYTFELIYDFEGWEEKRRLLIDALTVAVHVRLQHSPVLPQNADGYDLAMGDLERTLREIGVDLEELSGVEGGRW